METGGNKPAEVRRVSLGGGAKALGLSFEPGFLRLLYYSDRNGQEYIGSESFPLSEAERVISELPQDRHPLFAHAYSPVLSLVPKALFQDEEAGSWLRFTSDYNPDHNSLMWSNLHEYDAVVVYSIPREYEEWCSQRFPALRISHPIEMQCRLMHRAGLDNAWTMIVNKTGSVALITAFEGKKLHLANAIDSEHLEDLAYYILYGTKQLPCKSDDLKILLLGDAAESDYLKEVLASCSVPLDQCLRMDFFAGQGSSVSSSSIAADVAAYAGGLCA